MRAITAFAVGKAGRNLALFLLLGLVIYWAFSAFPLHGQTRSPKGQRRPMPEFTAQSPEHWVNSRPLKKADLKGKVVLLEIWTSI